MWVEMRRLYNVPLLGDCGSALSETLKQLLTPMTDRLGKRLLLLFRN